MKKILALILILCLCLPLVACGMGETGTPGGTTPGGEENPGTTNPPDSGLTGEEDFNGNGIPDNQETPGSSGDIPGGGGSQGGTTPGGSGSTPGGSQGGTTPGGSGTAVAAKGELAYKLNEDGASYTVIGPGTWYEPALVIPATYQGLPVTAVGNSAFDDDYYTSVTIENGVTTIEDYAFRNCASMTAITLPASVTAVGYMAFAGTGYEKNTANWENNVLYVGHCLIRADREKLSGAYTMKEGTRVLAGSAFADCTGLTAVTMPNSVESLGKAVFGDCTALSEITLSSALSTIGERTFYGCEALATIHLPDGVTALTGELLEDTAFYENEANWDGKLLYLGSCLIDSKKKDLAEETITVRPGTKYICAEVFYDSDAVGFVLPEGLLSIGELAFKGCNKVRAITLPTTLESIGADAFYYCSRLITMEIPASVKHIEGNVFVGCGWLEGITVAEGNTAYHAPGGVLYSKDNKQLLSFPQDMEVSEYTVLDGVEVILPQTFRGNDYIEKITLPNSLVEIGAEAFYEASIVEVVCGTGLKTIGAYAFQDSYLEKINLPAGLKTIESRAFYGTCITALTLPEGLEKIGGDAFRSSDLTTINLPKSLQDVGMEAFRSTPLYNEVANWDGDILYIGDVLVKADDAEGAVAVRPGTRVIASYAFQNCKDITTITLPEGLEIIGGAAFNNIWDGEVREIKVPASVTTIGNSAFANAGAKITFASGSRLQAIGDYAFESCQLGNFTVPTGVTAIGKGAFNWADLTAITLPAGITRIENETFKNCDTLTAITIPASVTYIGDEAFYECEALKTVSFASGSQLQAIGKRAFFKCQIRELVFPASLFHIGEYAFGENTTWDASGEAGLARVTFPAGLKYIGDYAFQYNSLLQDYQLPAGLVYNGKGAFAK